MPTALHPGPHAKACANTGPITCRITRRSPHPPARLAGCALAAALLLAGCASPYVRLSPDSDALAVQPQVLADAIGAARAKQREYHDQVINLGESERALSNSLLGLGTLIVGLGVAKVHPSAIAGAVLGTGAVYTFGTFNTDKRRAQVYVAGMKALDCAVDAVTPLVLSPTQEARLVDERAALAPAIAKTATAIGEAEQWAARARATSPTKFKDGLDAMQLALPAAQAAVDKAADAEALAGQRLDKPQQLAADLRGAVRAIDRAVLNDIRGTEPAVQAVPGILAGLQGNASLFSLASLAPGLVAASAAATKAGKDAPHDGIVAKAAGDEKPEDAIARRDQALLMGLTDALGTLRSRTVQLASQADRLSRAALMTAPQAVSTAVKACQVDGVLKPISVAPSSITLVAKAAGTHSVLVDGGNGEFSAQFLQSPTPGLSALRPPRSKGVVNIVATDQTVAGSYQLVIEDTTQQTRQIVTVVVGAATAAPPADDKKTDMTNAEAAADKLNKAGSLTTAKNVKVTGLKATTLGAQNVQLIYDAPADGQVTDAEVAAAALALPGMVNLLGKDPKHIVAQRAEPAPHSKTVKKTRSDNTKTGTVGKNDGAGKPAGNGDSGPTVRGMTVAEIKALQTRLCMAGAAATGTWTAQTQAALEADRARRLPAAGPVPAAGEALGAQERQRLQALSEADAYKRCGSK